MSSAIEKKETRCSARSRADVVVQQLCGRSRSQVRAMFQLGAVSRNGKVCHEGGTVVEPGDLIQVSFDPARRYREPKKGYSSKLFRVVFEDNYLLVVDKQAGFLTTPTEAEERRSLIASVNKYLSVKGARSAGASLVHRLDRDTSGLLVLAKHPNLAKTIKEQFKERKPKREYLAIVRGSLSRGKGTFRSFLATDEDLNQYSTEDEDSGKLAVTHYTVVRRYPTCTFVKVQLETGRRNQIRVHFAEHNHPVLGDTRYRPNLAKHPLWPHRRLALHAAELGFRHPVTKRELSFSSPMPDEMKELLKQMKKGDVPKKEARPAKPPAREEKQRTADGKRKPKQRPRKFRPPSRSRPA